MHLINRTALFGLFFNIIIVMLLFAGTNLGDFSAQPPEIQHMMSELAASSTFYLAYAILIGVQTLALWLIIKPRPSNTIGLGLACTSAFFLMPFSFIYLFGCISTHFTLRYSMFAKATPKDLGAKRVFNSAYTRTLAGMSIAGGLATFFILSNGIIDSIFVFILSATLGAAMLAIRSNSTYPLAIYDKYFTMSPHFFASKIIVEYKAIQKATLLNDETIRLDVNTDTGSVTLYWHLPTVKQEERKSAFEALAEKLAENHVLME